MIRILFIICIWALLPAASAAQQMSSENFSIDAERVDVGGDGTLSSESFILGDSFGEAITSDSVGGGGGVGGGSSSGGGGVLEHINTFNVPLKISPTQSGTLTQDVSAGKVVLDVPKNNISEKTTFIINEEPLGKTNSYFVSVDANLINSAFYDVTAIDQNGNPVTSFAAPITISLPILEGLIDATDLGVYWLDEIASQWVLIPDAIFDIGAGKVVFQINHLTKFAIFVVAGTPDILPISIITALFGEEEVPEVLGQADINDDGKVDIFDFNLLMVHWGKQPTGSFIASVGAALFERKSDINNDGIVDILDFNALLVQWTL